MPSFLFASERTPLGRDQPFRYITESDKGPRSRSRSLYRCQIILNQSAMAIILCAKQRLAAAMIISFAFFVTELAGQSALSITRPPDS